ncbi:hypothetical protein ACFY4C_01780 [Actinomadura viridis]
MQAHHRGPLARYGPARTWIEHATFVLTEPDGAPGVPSGYRTNGLISPDR